jgi:hypothetical protein
MAHAEVTREVVTRSDGTLAGLFFAADMTFLAVVNWALQWTEIVTLALLLAPANSPRRPRWWHAGPCQERGSGCESPGG